MSIINIEIVITHFLVKNGVVEQDQVRNEEWLEGVIEVRN